jgi:hypothetical protein
MWEYGHSFEEIDRMSLEDYGDLIGYWTEKNRADKKAEEKRQNKRTGRNSSRKG